MTRAGVFSFPRRWGLSSSRAGGADPGPRSGGERNRVGSSQAPQLSAGMAGPAPVAPPPPEPFPAAAAAEAGRGCTLGAGTHGSGRSFLPARVRKPASPAAPFSLLPDPGCAGGCRGRAPAARGGGRGEREDCSRREARSTERSPLQLQPRVPSLLPAPKTRRWRRQLWKEAPIPQRNSALLHRPPRAEGDSRGSAAAGSIGARTPEPSSSWPRPVPTRRAEGRAPRSPITAHRPPGPPRSASLGWETSDGRGDPGGGLLESRPTKAFRPQRSAFRSPEPPPHCPGRLGLVCLGRKLLEEL